MKVIVSIVMITLLTQLTFAQPNSATNNFDSSACPGIPTVVYAGSSYHTIQIGNQCWLRENLNVGTMIFLNKNHNVKDQTDNNVIEKYCYGDDESYCETYGGLYQWGEAVQYKNEADNFSFTKLEGNVQGICPSGWHIPSKKEFRTLTLSVAENGNSLKNIGQGIEDDGRDGRGTNTSGFSILLAGDAEYEFKYLKTLACFWSSTAATLPSSVYYLRLDHLASDIEWYICAYKSYAFSVRCIKD
jgi:uncharacterized protein (TIGR02145 family)